jgi:hypothetical protein
MHGRLQSQVVGSCGVAPPRLDAAGRDLWAWCVAVIRRCCVRPRRAGSVRRSAQQFGTGSLGDRAGRR